MTILNLTLVILVPFFASWLTLLSGFGLGTILLPTFAILFPVDIAIAMTAIVHFLNNILKLSLLGRKANKSVCIKFGIPAVLASFAGAFLLAILSHQPSILTYKIYNKLHHINILGIVIGILMIFFALMELIPTWQNFHVNKKFLPLGGALSGFFGGLSGHQGAFRSAFLVKLGLDKEAFIATGIVVACGVDFIRLFVYGFGIQSWSPIRPHVLLLILAIVASFAGSWIGRQTLRTATYEAIRWIVGILLMIFGALIAFGII